MLHNQSIFFAAFVACVIIAFSVKGEDSFQFHHHDSGNNNLMNECYALERLPDLGLAFYPHEQMRAKYEDALDNIGADSETDNLALVINNLDTQILQWEHRLKELQTEKKCKFPAFSKLCSKRKNEQLYLGVALSYARYYRTMRLYQDNQLIRALAESTGLLHLRQQHEGVAGTLVYDLGKKIRHAILEACGNNIDALLGVKPGASNENVERTYKYLKGLTNPSLYGTDSMKRDMQVAGRILDAAYTLRLSGGATGALAPHVLPYQEPHLGESVHSDDLPPPINGEASFNEYARPEVVSLANDHHGEHYNHNNYGPQAAMESVIASDINLLQQTTHGLDMSSVKSKTVTMLRYVVDEQYKEAVDVSTDIVNDLDARITLLKQDKTNPKQPEQMAVLNKALTYTLMHRVFLLKELGRKKEASKDKSRLRKMRFMEKLMKLKPKSRAKSGDKKTRNKHEKTDKNQDDSQEKKSKFASKFGRKSRQDPFA